HIAKIINNLLNPIAVVLLVIETRNELVVRNLGLFEDIESQGTVHFEDPLLLKVFKEVRIHRSSSRSSKPFSTERLKKIIGSINYNGVTGDALWEELFNINQTFSDYAITSLELGEAFRDKLVELAENIET